MEGASPGVTRVRGRCVRRPVVQGFCTGTHPRPGLCATSLKTCSTSESSRGPDRIYNQRGTTMRGPEDAGDQERELAREYASDANAVSDERPRTAMTATPGANGALGTRVPQSPANSTPACRCVVLSAQCATATRRRATWPTVRMCPLLCPPAPSNGAVEPRSSGIIIRVSRWPSRPSPTVDPRTPRVATPEAHRPQPS
jgi:hypothetical protein